MDPNNQVPVAPAVTNQAPIMNPGVLEGPRSLLASAWSLYKAHWKMLTGIVIAPSVVSLAGQLLLLTKNISAALLGIIVIFAGIIFSIAMLPAAVNAINRLSTEPSATLNFKSQYKFGFGLFWSVIFAAILQILIVLGSYSLFIIPGIIISGYVGMYIFALVLDNKRGFSALTESYSLIRGRWWGVIGRLLYFALVYIGGAIVMLLIQAGLDFILGFGAKSTGYAIVSILTSLVLSATLAPLALVYAYKLYIALKSSRMLNVSTVGFKKWLVTFLVIGIFAIILLPLLAGAVAVSIFGKYRSEIQNMPTPNGYTSINPGNGTNGTDYFPNTDNTGMIQGNRPGGAGPGPNIK